MATLAAKRKGIIAAAYVYLSLPVCIYFLGWLKPMVSIPMTLFFLYGTYIAIRNFNAQAIKTPAITGKQFWIVALMICAWVLLSGIGGYVWQNRFDHQFRNAVFQDLVHYDWPVVSENTSKILVYYFGYWMPSALAGKVFGLEAGYAFQVIWAIIGTGLAFCLMSYVLRKFSVVTMVVFIFFSGLDIIPFLISVFSNGYPAPDLFTGNGIFPHIEILFNLFNSSGNTTLLFWVYNQAIPFWICFLLILMQKNNRCLLFTYCLLALFAPFPMIGTLPAVVYVMLRNEGINHKNFFDKLGTLIKHQFNLQNLAGIASVLIIALFYATNVSAGDAILLPPTGLFFLWLLYFFMLEFGVYLLWLLPASAKNRLCITLMVSTLCFQFIRVGASYDFSWRTSMPFMFFLMIFVIQKLIHKWRQTKAPMKTVIILLLVIGAATPLLEIARSVNNTAVITIEKQHPGTFAKGTYEYDISQQPLRIDYLRGLVELTDKDIGNVVAFNNFLGNTSQDAYFNRFLRK